MISQFTVGNFLSFKDAQTIIFEASALKDGNENVFQDSELYSKGILKSISIQGNNSAGKSNFLKAIGFLKHWVVNSFSESNKAGKVPLQPFLLNEDSRKSFSFFEVIFYSEGLRYRYGVSLNEDFINEEWLFYAEPKKREQPFFVRKEKEFTFNNLWKRNSAVKIDPIVSYVKSSVLFISVLAQFNIDVGNTVLAWFNKNHVALDLNSEYFINRTASLAKEQEYFIAIHQLIDRAKLGFKTFEYDVTGKFKDSDKYDHDFLAFALKEEVDNYRIRTKHDVYSASHKKTGQELFDLRKQESAGTQKFFALVGTLLSAIKNREILWIDELDAKFHPTLFYTIVKFFNSNKFNHAGAQLIFTTHNTQLLKDRSLRRDQIYTVDKNEFGESTINGAYKFNVRMDISYEKQYFDGKYGGVQKIKLDDAQLGLFDSEQ